MVVKRRGQYYCVVHANKPGHIGEAIKCYSIKKYGLEGAKAKAEKMHRAISISKARAAGHKIPYPQGKKEIR